MRPEKTANGGMKIYHMYFGTSDSHAGNVNSSNTVFRETTLNVDSSYNIQSSKSTPDDVLQ